MAGRIINMKTATNQIQGAVAMGIGMGLLEQAIYDPRNGHPINDNYADYLVATNADVPAIDVHFLGIPDPMMGEYGARGLARLDWRVSRRRLRRRCITRRVCVCASCR